MALLGGCKGFLSVF